jgi:hypothetical protein
MCEHRLRNYSAGTIGHGTALPDLLLGLVALANSMRLSLMKAAHVALSSAARQEIRVRRRRICLRRRWPCTSHENTLPRKTGVENIERSVFNLEAVTAKKCDGEGKSVVKDYVSTGRTYTTRTRQYGARGRKRILG